MMSRIKPPGGTVQRQQPFDTAGYQKTFKDAECEACGAVGTTVGAHFNFEAGGMAFREPGAVAGLCFACHNIADGRTNASKEERDKIWLRVLKNVLKARAMAWKTIK
jgi:hypothetical protein